MDSVALASFLIEIRSLIVSGLAHADEPWDTPALSSEGFFRRMGELMRGGEISELFVRNYIASMAHEYVSIRLGTGFREAEELHALGNSHLACFIKALRFASLPDFDHLAVSLRRDVPIQCSFQLIDHDRFAPFETFYE